MFRRYPVSPPLLLLSVLLFTASLCGDSYYIEGDNPRAWCPAIASLLIGWIGLFDGIYAWLANPLLLLGWILLACRLKSPATILSTAAIAFILSLQLCKTILINEAGGRSPIIGYGIGYWLWLTSAVTLLLACIAARFESLPGNGQSRANNWQETCRHNWTLTLMRVISDNYSQLNVINK